MSRRVINLDTGDIYASAPAASRAVGFGSGSMAVRSAITQVTRAGGFRWAFEDDKDEQEKKYKARGIDEPRLLDRHHSFQERKNPPPIPYTPLPTKYDDIPPPATCPSCEARAALITAIKTQFPNACTLGIFIPTTEEPTCG